MKKKQEKPENSERWLITYSGLITLLMVLFVILYASSNIDTTKYKQLATSFQEAFNITPSTGGEVAVIEGQSVDNQNTSTATGKSTATISTGTAVMSEEEKLKQVKAEVDNRV